MRPQPLIFAEDRHAAIWGCERWLVSVHPSSPSVVRDGPFAGCRLDDLAERFGADLLGARACGRFPLLIKEIDAQRRLSVQVHPNEATCGRVGGTPKAEMWHVLAIRPGGVLFAGVKPGLTVAELERAEADGSIEDVVLRHDVAVGDGVFVPGGLIHALGDGVRVFEVQQSSDTTYRLYDWGRTDANGRPRQLHVREGLAAADMGALPVTVRGELVCPFFRVKPIELRGACGVPADPDSFRVLFAAQGGFALETEDGRREMRQGEAVLVPAVTAAEMTPLEGAARVVAVSLG